MTTEVVAQVVTDRPTAVSLRQGERRFELLITSTLRVMMTLRSGDRVHVRAEQDRPGFLQVTVGDGGRIFEPNGYVHRNDAGVCEAEGVVP